MKLNVLIAAALAATHLLAPSAVGKEAAAGSRTAAQQPLVEVGEDLNRLARAPRMVDCPKQLLDNPKSFSELTASIIVVEVEREIVNINLLAVPGTDALCAVMTKPELRALDVEEYRALLDLSRRSTTEVLMGDATDAKPSSMDPLAETKTLQCGQYTTAASVYAGRCGTSSTVIGSAYFMSSHLALSAGLRIPTSGDVCLGVGGSSVWGYAPITYYDVHAIRRSGSGQSQLAGLSLVRPGPVSAGFRVSTGALIGSWGAAHTLQVDGTLSDGRQTCQSGATNYYNTQFARFLGSYATAPYSAEFLVPGGAGSLVADAPSMPVGVHVDTLIQQTYDAFNRIVTSYNPMIRRNQSSDVAVLNGWASSAAPTAQQAINITSPANNSLVDSALPIQVSVASAAAYTLQLDGQTISNTINSPVDGWHTLVAFNPTAPQFRHTLRFETRRLSVPADAYEVDDTREAWRALNEGSPQTHNFHKSLDTDWMAFAVGANVMTTVKLTGAVARNASLKLYRQDPSGAVILVASQSNVSTRLQVSHLSPPVGDSGYYVEVKPTSTSAHGPGSDYTMSVTTASMAPALDEFEADDTRDAWKPLNEGSPQVHTFHHAYDQDWVAYAVGPGATHRVQLQGEPAAGARLEMYRHDNYPIGKIELVDVSAGQANMLTVEHTAPTGRPYEAYFVLATPDNGNALAVRSSYTLTVTSQ